MTAASRQDRLTTERRLIREASQRLLARTPQRSNGSLAVAALAAEAALPRYRLYEHHADLVAEFKTAALAGGPAVPGAEALRQQLADAGERIRHLKASEAQLKAKITTLCAIITELTHEATAGNIVAMPAKRPP